MSVPAGSDDFEGELADDLRARVKTELYPGERLLWAARAEERKGSRGERTSLAPFVTIFLWLVTMVSFTVVFRNAQTDSMGWFVFVGLLSGVVAFVMTLVIISGSSGRRAERERLANTLYALTDRRAIIWTPRRGKGGIEVHTFPRGKLGHVHRVEYADGSGDVVFSLPGVHSEFGYWAPQGFQGVLDVRRVEEQVRRTLIDDTARSA